MTTEKIERAAKRLEKLLRESESPVYGQSISSVDHMRSLLQARLGREEREVFFVYYLTNQHAIIDGITEFYGTIDQSAVYPREIVKRALSLNACAVIFAHNHPSGLTEPSLADIEITRKLKEALGLVDVRVLDHFIVGDGVISFAERGLI